MDGQAKLRPERSLSTTELCNNKDIANKQFKRLGQPTWLCPHWTVSFKGAELCRHDRCNNRRGQRCATKQQVPVFLLAIDPTREAVQVGILD
mmetsp:Transcript_21193/g.45232  ORF Transcript_21193/g.45232 Transcript_21193/m.45232 type:complete len:92 (+) Transcript_21193:30-305(+)